MINTSWACEHLGRGPSFTLGLFWH